VLQGPVCVMNKPLRLQIPKVISAVANFVKLILERLLNNRLSSRIGLGRRQGITSASLYIPNQ
jgi:hypothetical protein